MRPKESIGVRAEASVLPKMHQLYRQSAPPRFQFLDIGRPMKCWSTIPPRKFRKDHLIAGQSSILGFGRNGENLEDLYLYTLQDHIHIELLLVLRRVFIAVNLFIDFTNARFPLRTDR